MNKSEYRFRKVAVLCAQKNGVYSQSSGAVGQFGCTLSQIVDVDLWDKTRNAFNFKGGLPVVAHPPCRLWGTLKGMPKISAEERAEEKNLGRHCVMMVIENGGVLEHPADSDLFADMGLPAGGYANEKGFTRQFPNQKKENEMFNRKKVIPAIPDQRVLIQTAWAFSQPSVEQIDWLLQVVETKAKSIRGTRTNSVQEIESSLTELGKATEAIEFLKSLEEVISEGGQIYGKK